LLKRFGLRPKGLGFRPKAPTSQTRQTPNHLPGADHPAAPPAAPPTPPSLPPPLVPPLAAPLGLGAPPSPPPRARPAVTAPRFGAGAPPSPREDELDETAASSFAFLFFWDFLFLFCVFVCLFYVLLGVYAWFMRPGQAWFRV